MDAEMFEVPHAPKTLLQMAVCTYPGEEHTVHRRITELAHYSCNCGYSSGWVPRSTLPLPGDFIREHMPQGTAWFEELSE